MSWFIFSEVMFFAAFFGALFYVRNLSVPWSGRPGIQAAVAELHRAAGRPPARTSRTQFTPMAASGIPLLNTIMLLSSGVTLTIAHHALKAGHRGKLKLWLFLTIVLGFTFLGFQAYEYTHAYSELNLKLTTGVYGSTFFMLTGFHGFHVTIGAIMLIGDAGADHPRAISTPEHHFAFEARRGTGTSSTSSGCCCSSSSTGSERDARAHAERKAARATVRLFRLPSASAQSVSARSSPAVGLTTRNMTRLADSATRIASALTIRVPCPRSW